MPQTVRDLTVDQLRAVITETVTRALEDRLEDLQALSSPTFKASIAEAREDRRAGRVISLEELLAR